MVKLEISRRERNRCAKTLDFPRENNDDFTSRGFLPAFSPPAEKFGREATDRASMSPLEKDRELRVRRKALNFRHRRVRNRDEI
jgi:hypothetical protein